MAFYDEEVKDLYSPQLYSEIYSYQNRLEFFGTEYGGYNVYIPFKDFLNPIVYSFGIGMDISFDEKVIERFGANVYAFDPTQKSIEWIQNQITSEKFHFFGFGLSDKDGSESFHLPVDDFCVSGSVHKHCGVKNESVKVEMRCFETIIKELKHRHIDILKMDIEGSEFDVMPDVL